MSADLKNLLAEATPGPWKASDCGEWVEDARKFEIANTSSSVHDIQEIEANARLIALAPDLARQVIALTAENAALRAKAEKLAEALPDMIDLAQCYLSIIPDRRGHNVEKVEKAEAALTEWETP